MGFWDALNAGGPRVTQKDIDKVYQAGRDQGNKDMAQWCKNLQEIVLAEVAMSVGQRTVLDETLRELEKLDPGHWLLVRENRLRIAGDVQKEAQKFSANGIASPNGFVYHRRADGFLEKRDAQWSEGEVVGVVREPGGKATPVTIEDVGLNYVCQNPKCRHLFAGESFANGIGDVSHAPEGVETLKCPKCGKKCVVKRGTPSDREPYKMGEDENDSPKP